MKELNQYHINYFINQLENKNLEIHNFLTVRPELCRRMEHILTESRQNPRMDEDYT